MAFISNLETQDKTLDEYRNDIGEHFIVAAMRNKFVIGRLKQNPFDVGNGEKDQVPEAWMTDLRSRFFVKIFPDLEASSHAEEGLSAKQMMGFVYFEKFPDSPAISPESLLGLVEKDKIKLEKQISDRDLLVSYFKKQGFSLQESTIHEEIQKAADAHFDGDVQKLEKALNAQNYTLSDYREHASARLIEKAMNAYIRKQQLAPSTEAFLSDLRPRVAE